MSKAEVAVSGLYSIGTPLAIDVDADDDRITVWVDDILTVGVTPVGAMTMVVLSPVTFKLAKPVGKFDTVDDGGILKYYNMLPKGNIVLIIVKDPGALSIPGVFIHGAISCHVNGVLGGSSDVDAVGIGNQLGMVRFWASCPVAARLLRGGDSFGLRGRTGGVIEDSAAGVIKEVAKGAPGNDWSVDEGELTYKGKQVVLGAQGALQAWDKVTERAPRVWLLSDGTLTTLAGRTLGKFVIVDMLIQSPNLILIGYGATWFTTDDNNKLVESDVPVPTVYSSGSLLRCDNMVPINIGDIEVDISIRADGTIKVVDGYLGYDTVKKTFSVSLKPSKFNVVEIIPDDAEVTLIMPMFKEYDYWQYTGYYLYSHKYYNAVNIEVDPKTGKSTPVIVHGDGQPKSNAFTYISTSGMVYVVDKYSMKNYSTVQGKLVAVKRAAPINQAGWIQPLVDDVVMIDDPLVGNSMPITWSFNLRYNQNLDDTLTIRDYYTLVFGVQRHIDVSGSIMVYLVNNCPVGSTVREWGLVFSVLGVQGDVRVPIRDFADHIYSCAVTDTGIEVRVDGTVVGSTKVAVASINSSVYNAIQLWFPAVKSATVPHPQTHPVSKVVAYITRITAKNSTEDVFDTFTARGKCWRRVGGGKAVIVKPNKIPWRGGPQLPATKEYDGIMPNTRLKGYNIDSAGGYTPCIDGEIVFNVPDTTFVAGNNLRLYITLTGPAYSDLFEFDYSATPNTTNTRLFRWMKPGKYYTRADSATMPPVVMEAVCTGFTGWDTRGRLAAYKQDMGASPTWVAGLDPPESGPFVSLVRWASRMIDHPVTYIATFLNAELVFNRQSTAGTTVGRWAGDYVLKQNFPGTKLIIPRTGIAKIHAIFMCKGSTITTPVTDEIDPTDPNLLFALVPTVKDGKVILRDIVGKVDVIPKPLKQPTPLQLLELPDKAAPPVVPAVSAPVQVSPGIGLVIPTPLTQYSGKFLCWSADITINGPSKGTIVQFANTSNWIKAIDIDGNTITVNHDWIMPNVTFEIPLDTETRIFIGVRRNGDGSGVECVIYVNGFVPPVISGVLPWWFDVENIKYPSSVTIGNFKGTVSNMKFQTFDTIERARLLYNVDNTVPDSGTIILACSTGKSLKRIVPTGADIAPSKMAPYSPKIKVNKIPTNTGKWIIVNDIYGCTLSDCRTFNHYAVKQSNGYYKIGVITDDSTTHYYHYIALYRNKYSIAYGNIEMTWPSLGSLFKLTSDGLLKVVDNNVSKTGYVACFNPTSQIWSRPIISTYGIPDSNNTMYKWRVAPTARTTILGIESTEFHGKLDSPTTNSNEFIQFIRDLDKYITNDPKTISNKVREYEYTSATGKKLKLAAIPEFSLNDSDGRVDVTTLYATRYMGYSVLYAGHELALDDSCVFSQFTNNTTKIDLIVGGAVKYKKMLQGTTPPGRRTLVAKSDSCIIFNLAKVTL